MQFYDTPDSLQPRRSLTGAFLRHNARSLILVAWLLFAGLLLVLFVAATPLALALLQTFCDRRLCFSGQVFGDSLWVLEAIGMSVPAYGLANVVIRLIGALSYTCVGAILILRRPDDRMAVLGAFMLLLDGVSVSGIIYALEQPWLLSWALQCFGLLGNVLVTWFFYVFPRGRFASRWMLWLACFWIISGTVLALVPPSPSLRWLGRLSSLHLALWLLSLVVVQYYHYHTARTATERQQTKWITTGVMLGYGPYALAELARFIAAVNGQQISWLSPFLTSNLLYLTAPLVPITFGMAILRARLYDIDIIINRALVYGILTACVAGVYVLLVGGLGQLVQGQHPLLSLLAVGVIAVAVQPLRIALQRGANRLVYGHRDEPYVVLARLGQRIGVALSPTELLPTVAETVRETLKLPYVAVALREDDTEVVVASSGAPATTTLTIPLVYQHAPVGHLVLGQRSAGEPFTRKEQHLLGDLAHQISIAARAVQLTHDLQRSRTNLVTAREEERRRLQRDLHDGLGPTLASLTMQLDAARGLMQDDPATSAALLDEVQEQLKATVGNVRRLVHQLRPPVLDQFGLVAAVREHALRVGQVANLRVWFDAPESLPTLPAAVEVAAYYIAVEALTNVIRHAQASNCSISFRMADGLVITVADDGQGLSAEYAAGVGMHSMRERAAELGGTWTITTGLQSGTVVRARLPL